MYETKHLFSYLVITAVLFLGMGFCMGKYYSNFQNSGVQNSDEFQRGWEAAKKRAISSGFVPFAENDLSITSASGEV